MAKHARPGRSWHRNVVALAAALSAAWLVAGAPVGKAGAIDTKAPTVSVTSPNAGDTVEGTTTLRAKAPGADKVNWYVDGVGVASVTSAAWRQSWDSRTVPDGIHQVYAIGTDAAGNNGTSATVTFTVLNGSPPPSPSPLPSLSPSPSPSPLPSLSPSPSPSGSPSATTLCGTTDTAPVTWQHVVWIVMENKSYSDIIGNTNAPYINSLLPKCGLATNFYAEAHPSLPNYIAMTSGGTQGITDDSGPSSHPLSVASIFSQLGSRWKSLEETMPGNCYLSNSGNYAVRHNPAAYYTNVRTQCGVQDVPLGSTPDLSGAFTFVTPNLCNDMHSCPTQSDPATETRTGDTWLSTFMPKVVNSPEYQAGNTAVFLTWDEDDYATTSNQRVATLVIAPSVAKGSLVATTYSHYSMLRTTEELLGVPLLGSAATATSMRTGFHL